MKSLKYVFLFIVTILKFPVIVIAFRLFFQIVYVHPPVWLIAKFLYSKEYIDYSFFQYSWIFSGITIIFVNLLLYFRFSSIATVANPCRRQISGEEIRLVGVIPLELRLSPLMVFRVLNYQTSGLYLFLFMFCHLNIIVGINYMINPHWSFWIMLAIMDFIVNWIWFLTPKNDWSIIILDGNVVLKISSHDRALEHVTGQLEKIPLSSLESFKQHSILPTGILPTHTSFFISPTISWRIEYSGNVDYITSELITYLNEIILKEKVNCFINERQNRELIDELYYPKTDLRYSEFLQNRHKRKISEKLNLWNTKNQKNQISNYNPENLKAQFNGQLGFLDINQDGELEFKDVYYKTIKIFSEL